MKNNKNPLNEKKTQDLLLYRNIRSSHGKVEIELLFITFPRPRKSCEGPDNSTDKSVIKQFVTTTILTATK